MHSVYEVAQVNFEKKASIGAEGKNSLAFLAIDHQLGAEIVIKQIKKTDIENQETFFEEARKLYATAHQYVVSIHYACQDENNVYIAIPYYSKGSLKAAMNKRLLTVREVLRYSFHIISALHNIHSKGLIHFDIKPDNILLSDRDEALLSDFGLASWVNPEGFATPESIYNRMAPPEFLQDGEFSTASDIYQFGLTLYRMCNGDGHFYDQLNSLTPETFYDYLGKGLFPDRKAFLPHIPSKLRKVIRRCLEVLPADRYETVLELANDLAHIDGEHLDWQFVTSDLDAVWTKEKDGMLYEFTHFKDGSTTLTKGRTGAAKKRVTAACLKSAKTKDIEGVLGSY